MPYRNTIEATKKVGRETEKETANVQMSRKSRKSRVGLSTSFYIEQNSANVSLSMDTNEGRFRRAFFHQIVYLFNEIVALGRFYF